MMQENLNNQNYLKEEESIDIKKEAGYYLFFWPYFLAGVVIAMISAFLYLKTADRIYISSAQLQIKKPAEDAASFLTGGMEFFGFDQVNVENDIAVLTSQHILSQVVTRLDLQTKIYTVGRVNAQLRFDDEYTRFVTLKTPNNYVYWDVEIENNKASFTRDTLSFTINKGEVFTYKESEIILHDSLYLKNQTLIVERFSLNDAVTALRNNLIATAASKQGEIIDLKFQGVNIARNEAVLNTVMQVMQDDQVEDKRLISKVSLTFINDRLDGLTKSIDTLSQNTIAFQTANGIFDPAAQTSNALSNIVKGQEEAFGIGIQLEIAKALLEKLESQASYQLLPANIGIENESVNTLVNSYNTVVTQRNNLLISATTKSPMVLQLSSQLDNAKSAIITGVNRYIEGLQTSLSGFKNMEAKTKGIVAGLPSKENTLRAYARDFKIVEELYVFLLERKEEASISYISALPNIKLLSYGVSSKYPIAPKVQITYLAALLLGILVPFGIFFLLKILDTKINTRDDLEAGLKGITILGEMPLAEDVNNANDSARGIIAESARVLRSGLSFQLQIDKTNVICVTSTIKGEGKSFVSYNLAQSYSALGKKVILVGADLRNPQLHKFLGQKRENLGLTTYLSNQNYNDIPSLITKSATPGGLDYLLTGAIPPNPSELLMRSRFKKLLEELKQSYDVILIDTAPLLLVSDTTAILPHCDSVVYVARSQYSEKKTFSFILNMQQRENVPPFGMVLNGMRAGAATGTNYGYKYRYSYGYGYSYNYGYGYGYGSDSEGN
ncbi:polysaccharide biosynthesis tyrosine autokinase [Flavobacteriaceae bacterium]|nr:polysaccharide biosynthesis tyrosine autokinase [Flavobacteriaceae bacterium]